MSPNPEFRETPSFVQTVTPDILLSVVIPSYRSFLTIRAAVTALKAELTGIEAEIIVVDSTGDGRVAAICRTMSGVRCLEPDRRMTAGVARNAGAQESRGRWLLFMDADCIPASGFGAQLGAHLDGGDWILSGAIENGTPDSWVGTLQYWTEFSEYAPGRESGERDFLSSYLLLMPKKLFQKVGGFSPEYAMSEDTVFSLDARSSDVSLIIDSAFRVKHMNRQSGRAVIRHTYRLGWWGGHLRRLKTGLSGSFLVRFPFLIPMLWPVRYGRIVRRLWSYGEECSWRKLGISILIFPLIGIWVSGFFIGILSRTR